VDVTNLNSKLNLLFDEILNEIELVEKKNRELHASAIDIEDEELSLKTQKESFVALRKMRALKDSLGSFKTEAENSGVLIGSGDDSGNTSNEDESHDARGVLISHEHGKIELPELPQKTEVIEKSETTEAPDEIGGLIGALGREVEEINNTDIVSDSMDSEEPESETDCDFERDLQERQSELLAKKQAKEAEESRLQAEAEVEAAEAEEEAQLQEELAKEAAREAERVRLQVEAEEAEEARLQAELQERWQAQLREQMQLQEELQAKLQSELQSDDLQAELQAVQDAAEANAEPIFVEPDFGNDERHSLNVVIDEDKSEFDNAETQESENVFSADGEFGDFVINETGATDAIETEAEVVSEVEETESDEGIELVELEGLSAQTPKSSEESSTFGTFVTSSENSLESLENPQNFAGVASIPGIESVAVVEESADSSEVLSSLKGSITNTGEIELVPTVAVDNYDIPSFMSEMNASEMPSVGEEVDAYDTQNTDEKISALSPLSPEESVLNASATNIEIKPVEMPVFEPVPSPEEVLPVNIPAVEQVVEPVSDIELSVKPTKSDEKPTVLETIKDDDFSGFSHTATTGIYHSRVLDGFTMFGRRVEVSNWSEMLVRVCEILILKNPYTVAQFDKYEDLNPMGSFYFSYNQNRIKGSPRKLSNGLWVELNRTPDDIVMLCKKVLELCGYPRSELEIEFAD